MKTLKTVFKAKLVRYNFNEPCMSMSREFDHYPTEFELLEFLSDCNEKDDNKDFKTTINVEKTYVVINVQ